MSKEAGLYAPQTAVEHFKPTKKNAGLLWAAKQTAVED